jgi:hypothetical protein
MRRELFPKGSTHYPAGGGELGGRAKKSYQISDRAACYFSYRNQAIRWLRQYYVIAGR